MNAVRLKEITHALLRIVAGLMFWQHGAQKILGLLGGVNGEGARAGFLSWPFGVAGALEFLGGILILLGVKTRWVAFLLAGEMATAYWWSHFPRAFWPIMNRGELPVLYCFIFLLLWAHGSGPWSVDGLLRRNADGG